VTGRQASDVEQVLDGIHAAGITLVASLPEFNLFGLIERLERDERLLHVPLSREEEGVGIAAGAFLGGRMPALVIQNAGLLNACNALVTTAIQFEIPMLLLVWYAGHLGDSSFMRLGEVTEPVLRALGIRTFLPADATAARAVIPQAATLSRQSMRPVAVLLTTAVLGRSAA
jgi:sulfopyruvate decarboxylase subunit alpha